MTWNLRNIEHGHVAANYRYFRSAIQHFMRKYGQEYFVVFVVISDDMRWTKMKFAEIEEKGFMLYYVEGQLREVCLVDQKKILWNLLLHRKRR